MRFTKPESHIMSTLPSWKIELLEKKQKREIQQRQKQEEECQRSSKIPAWKLDLIKKKQKNNDKNDGNILDYHTNVSDNTTEAPSEYYNSKNVTNIDKSSISKLGQNGDKNSSAPVTNDIAYGYGYNSDYNTYSQTSIHTGSSKHRVKRRKNSRVFDETSTIGTASDNEQEYGPGFVSKVRGKFIKSGQDDGQSRRRSSSGLSKSVSLEHIPDHLGDAMPSRRDSFKRQNSIPSSTGMVIYDSRIQQKNDTSSTLLNLDYADPHLYTRDNNEKGLCVDFRERRISEASFDKEVIIIEKGSAEVQSLKSCNEPGDAMHTTLGSDHQSHENRRRSSSSREVLIEELPQPNTVSSTRTIFESEKGTKKRAPLPPAPLPPVYTTTQPPQLRPATHHVPSNIGGSYKYTTNPSTGIDRNIHSPVNGGSIIDTAYKGTLSEDQKLPVEENVNDTVSGYGMSNGPNEGAPHKASNKESAKNEQRTIVSSKDTPVKPPRRKNRVKTPEEIPAKEEAIFSHQSNDTSEVVDNKSSSVVKGSVIDSNIKGSMSHGPGSEDTVHSEDNNTVINKNQVNLSTSSSKPKYERDFTRAEEKHSSKHIEEEKASSKHIEDLQSKDITAAPTTQPAKPKSNTPNKFIEELKKAWTDNEDAGWQFEQLSKTPSLKNSSSDISLNNRFRSAEKKDIVVNGHSEMISTEALRNIQRAGRSWYFGSTEGKLPPGAIFVKVDIKPVAARPAYAVRNGYVQDVLNNNKSKKMAASRPSDFKSSHSKHVVPSSYATGRNHTGTTLVNGDIPMTNIDDVPVTNIDDVLIEESTGLKESQSAGCLLEFHGANVKLEKSSLNNGKKSKKIHISFSDNCLEVRHEYQSEKSLMDELGLTYDNDYDFTVPTSNDDEDEAAVLGETQKTETLKSTPALGGGSLANYSSKYAVDYQFGMNLHKTEEQVAPPTVENTDPDDLQITYADDAYNWSESATSDLLF